MTTRLETLVKNANAVTDDDQLDRIFGDDVDSRLLREILAREEGRMTEIEYEKTDETSAIDVDGARTPMPRRRLTAGLVSFVVVVAVGLGVALNSMQDPAASVVGLAEAYQLAITNYDPDAAVALMDPDAENATGYGLPVEELPGQIRWYEVTGWTETVTGCEQLVAGPPAEVRCTYTFENDWTRALGVGPYDGHTDFVIENGKITDVVATWSAGTTFSGDAWQPFIAWVGVAHYPDHQAITTNNFSRPVWTPEALELWDRYTNEFVAEKGD